MWDGPQILKVSCEISQLAGQINCGKAKLVAFLPGWGGIAGGSVTHTYVHTRTHTRLPRWGGIAGGSLIVTHTHAYTHMHMHTHVCMHARTHMYTHAYQMGVVW